MNDIEQIKQSRAVSLPLSFIEYADLIKAGKIMIEHLHQAIRFRKEKTPNTCKLLRERVEGDKT